MSEERVAFVTGGSRGIGRALCEELLGAGWRVHTCATSAGSVEMMPEGVTRYVCDVSDPDDVAEMFAMFADEEERLDLLVNNAGVLGPRKALEAVSKEEWRRTFAVNADGPFLVTSSALPSIRAARGTIVNVSSSVGRRGRGGWGPYACSKHALEGLTDVLADELRDDGIVVVSVNPGGTATDMRAEAVPDEDPTTLPTAREIAAVILRLAREASIEDSAARWNCRDHL